MKLKPGEKIVQQYNVPRDGWSEVAEIIFRQLWDAGELSGNQIGAIFGLKKNSVLSRAHRLNLKGRGTPIKSSPPSRKTINADRVRAGAEPLCAFHPISWGAITNPERDFDAECADIEMIEDAD